jgi:hypothetical protein
MSSTKEGFKWGNTALGIAAIVTFAYTLVLGALGQSVVMGISVVIFFGILFFLNLSKFASFKASASGLEAQTRENVVKVEATLAQLQNMAGVLGKITVSLLVRHSRLGSFTDAEHDKCRGEIKAVLQSLGLSDFQIEECFSDIHKYTKYDYVFHILGDSRAPSHLGHDAIEEWKQFRHRVSQNTPTPQELENFLKKYGLLNSEREEQLKDYEHYIRKHLHRRPEEWARREEWSLKNN